MLTKDQNELLTRVSAGTPMGDLLRRYWMPALLSWELPEPDCAPIRTRLFGENYVVFRDTAGKIGVLDEYCMHRRASLAAARERLDLPAQRRDDEIDVEVKIGKNAHHVYYWSQP